MTKYERNVMERPQKALRKGSVDVASKTAFLKLKIYLAYESVDERKLHEESF
jgi:hypothetical protein